MRWDHLLRPLAAAVILALAWPSLVSAAPHGSSLEVDVGLFYDELAPYGRWYEVDDYGWVWRPRVSTGWRPYTVGQWVWTDEYGWIWTSAEPYSWAVYHYGRWDWDPELGWFWVPGYDWAPAWVSFRSGGGYVGWAPLSPRVHWDVGVGFRVGGVQLDAYVSPRHYCFVDERSFLDRDIGRRAFPVSRNVTIINVTQNITNYDVSGGRVRNRSLSVDRVERFTRRAVPRVRAADVNSVREVRNARLRGDRVEVFRPVVRRDADRLQVERRPPDGRRLGRAIAQGSRTEPQASSRVLEERRQAEDRREIDGRREAEYERQKARQREAERAQPVERQREDERRRLAERARRAEQQRAAERQRELDRQREADRREQERRVARVREEREEQRRELEKRQQREREAIETRHRQEIRRPSRDPREDLDRRHSQEHRAVDERGQDSKKKDARKREREKDRSKERPPSGR